MTIAMQPTLFLQIFSGYLVISTRGLCGPDEYPITGRPGRKCLPCDKCHEGQGLVPKCGTPIKDKVDKIECKPCESGKFSDTYDSSSCHVCHQCVENEKVTVPCTKISDTVCNGTCKKGFYFSKKDGTHSCQKCSHCCFDDQDEEVPECKEQGLTEFKLYCAPRPDKDCTPPPHEPTGGKHGSDTSKNKKLSQTTIIVLIVVGTAIVLALISTVTVYCYKRRKIATGDHPKNYKPHPEFSSSNFGKKGNIHGETVNASPSGTCVNGVEGISAFQNVVTLGTSSQDQEIRSAPSVPEPGVSVTQGTSSQDQEIRIALSVPEPGVSEVVTTIPNNVQHERSAESVFGAEVRRPKSDGGRKQSFIRSLSRDSQKSGDDANRGGNRSRKSSLSSLSGTLRQAIKPLNPKGTDTCNLVDNIEEHVDDLEQEYKSLTDVQQQDFQTYERVGHLLSQKKHGLGGWREVAHKYKMDQVHIDALRNDPEAGSKTLGYLESAVPGLTVYDFCETLKEHHIRRLDIVKELEKHVSALGTATG